MADADWPYLNDEEFITLETNAAPEVTTVRLYKETVAHIVENHVEFRGELPSVIASISNTVENPTHVYRSNNQHAGSYVFQSTENAFFDNPMYVPVRLVEGTLGRVTTAVYSDEVPGTLIWEKQ